MSRMIRPFVAAALMCGVLPVASAWAQPEASSAGGRYQKIIDAHASALVSVKFVLEAGGEFGGGEQEMDAAGVMIEPGGLVVCSNSSFGGMFAAMMGGGAMSPKNIRVLIGDDTKGVEGKLIARDSELDLAWIQIDKPDPKGYAHVDFSKGAEASLGSPLVALSKMGKFFDRAPVIGSASVGGVTSKPRRLLVPDTFFMTFGTPVFAPDGTPIGLTVVQTPSPEEMEADASGMGGMGSMDSFRGLILPGSEIVSATRRAKETAAANPDGETPADDKPADAPSGEPK